jgi:DnaJ-domain-containing protein 1
MTRPLARHGIAQLEELFAASLVDEKILKNLETELRYRQVPRAVSLLAQVQRALYSGPTAALSDAPRIQRHGLTVQKAATSDLATIGSPSMVLPYTSPGTVAPLKVVTQPRGVTLDFSPPRSAKLLDAQAPPLSVVAAYQVLKASPSSTWESIEQTRRQLVQLAQPDRVAALSTEARAEAQAVAKRANAAYALLRQARGA